MAKRKAATTMSDTMETVKPYLARALNDEEFRNDLKDALAAARELYGPLSKQNGVSGGARALATDKKAQEQMRRAIDDLLSAKDTLQGNKQKKGHKGRNMDPPAGIIAGALYNPWTWAADPREAPGHDRGPGRPPAARHVRDDGRRRRRDDRGRRREGRREDRRGRQGSQVEDLLLGGLYGFALERASPPASARCSAPGTRPLAPEMSLAVRSTAPARRCDREAVPGPGDEVLPPGTQGNDLGDTRLLQAPSESSR